MSWNEQEQSGTTKNNPEQSWIGTGRNCPTDFRLKIKNFCVQNTFLLKYFSTPNSEPFLVERWNFLYLTHFLEITKNLYLPAFFLVLLEFKNWKYSHFIKQSRSKHDKINKWTWLTCLLTSYKVTTEGNKESLFFVFWFSQTTHRN